MFYHFYNFRTSKDLEILRQSTYMSHILKGLSKRNMHIPHNIIVLYDEEKWQKMCSNAYFGFFTGGGPIGAGPTQDAFVIHIVILNNNLKAVKLGLAEKEDLRWWANFSETFNGKEKIAYPEYELPLISDSLLLGFTIYTKGKNGSQEPGIVP